MLYGPANRTDFVAKFVASGTDIGVLDLEDAVHVDHKDDARKAISDAEPGAGDLGRMVLFVRVNSLALGALRDDLHAASNARARGIIIPKVESAGQLQVVRAEMARLGLGDAKVCAGVESALGVHNAVEIAQSELDLMYFGAEDYIADLGGHRTESNAEVAMARSRVAMAAAIGSVPALDQVVLDYGDDGRFQREAATARAMGYVGKMCIHPSQVALANEAFMPTDGEIAWANGVLDTAREAATQGTGVFSYEGEMVDEPVLRRARRILAI